MNDPSLTLFQIIGITCIGLLCIGRGVYDGYIREDRTNTECFFAMCMFLSGWFNVSFALAWNLVK